MEMMQRVKRWYRLFSYWQENGRVIKPMQMQTVTCKHCGTRYQGNYCPRCGQSQAVSLITKRGFINAFMEAYPQLASTFLRTCLELLLRPGYMIRDYFRGHRVIYSGPFKTFIIIISIYVLLGKLMGITPDASNKSVVTFDWSNNKTQKEQVNMPKPTDDEMALLSKVKRASDIEQTISDSPYLGPVWNFIKKKAQEQGSVYLFLCVPLLAWASKLAFRRREFDGRQLIYAEHFMVFTYIYVINISFCLLAFVLCLPGASEDSFDYPKEIILLYVLWTFKGLYGLKWKETLRYMWKFVLWTLLFFTIAIALVVAITICGITLL